MDDNKKGYQVNFPINVRTVSVIFVYLYALFAFTRIKNMWAPRVDGIVTTNEIWLIIAVSLLLLLRYSGRLFSKRFNVSYLLFLVLLSLYVVGGLRVISLDQWLYAGALLFLPLLLYLSIPRFSAQEIHFLIRLFIIISLIYAILAIILSLNYAYFMTLVGNPVDNYRYYSQYRAPMMLGSSIVVSNYFVISIPFSMYLFYKEKNKFWKKISILAVIICFMAILVLNSRLAFVGACVAVAFCLFFLRKQSRRYIKQSVILAIFLAVGILIVFNNFDVSRLSLLTDWSGESALARRESARLGLEIFNHFPLLGSGMGAYFTRAYTYRFVSFQNITGLVDPHNLYVLILSEMGLIGFCIIILFVAIALISLRKIPDLSLRRTAYVQIIAMIILSLGGSHLLIQISFSSIFWIYMAMYKGTVSSNLQGNPVLKGNVKDYE